MTDLMNGIPKFSHAHKEPAMQKMFKGWSHIEFFKEKQCFEAFINPKGEIKYTSELAKHFLYKSRKQLLDYIGDKYLIKETICR